jgi:hypothetical protein
VTCITGWPDGAVLSVTRATANPLPSSQFPGAAEPAQPPLTIWTLSKYASSVPAFISPFHSSIDSRACVIPAGITIWRDRLCQPLAVALTTVVAPNTESV